MILVASMIGVVLAQAPTATLSGTVAGPDGQPVAGAEVRLAGMPVFDPPILARTRTDAQGRFALQRPADLVAQDTFIAPILWVAKPGYRLAFVRFTGPMPKAAEPVRIALRPPGQAEVRVDGPDGRPLAGARVRIQWLGQPFTYVPDEVGALVEATTNNDGLAVLDVGDNREVTYVDVHSPAFGIQGRPFTPPTSKPKVVRLRPAASLKGRLVADDPAMARGWRVRAYTRSGTNSRNPETTGFAEGTTDAEGRFSFPVIAPGGLQLELKPPRDLPVLPEIPTGSPVVAGRENALEVPLRKPATVTGIIRELGTGRPIPGFELYFSPLRGGSRVLRGTTDAQGRYTFPSLPGTMRISVFQTPPTHVVVPGKTWRDVTVPAGAGRIELEPWDAIPAAPPLRFVVRDEAGRPAPRATITGQSHSRYIPKTTDDNGEFTVPGVPPGTEVSIEVRLGDRATDGPVKVRAGGTEPVPVTIRPGLVLALAGRVVGPGRTPVPDALVTVRYREKDPQGGRFPFPHPLQLTDPAEIRTATDGTFRTPKEVYSKNREFRVEASAEGFLPGQTEWVSSEGGDALTMPDLTLRRARTLRSVAGRVVDRQGRGVDGASVFQSGDGERPTATTADGEGRFRLGGVPDGTALVFAEKAGFRFGGALVGPGPSSVEIRLARAEEPPLSVPKPAPPLLSRAEERAMARELLAPVVVAARAGMLGRLEGSVIPALARIDPDRVLEMLEDRVVRPSPEIIDPIALAKQETDPAAAVATVEADHDPFARADGFLAIAGAVPEADRARQTELIDRALAEARRVENPEARLSLLGRIADRWLEWGDIGRASPIVREGRALIAALPKDRYSFAAEAFAERLAVVDLPTARAIFKRNGRTNVGPADAATINRHLAEAAVRLAAIDPAGADRLITDAGLNFRDNDRADQVIEVCRRMARADGPRARRILEMLGQAADRASAPGPTLLAMGFCLIAADLAATDPAGARRLLDEAFDRLREVASGGTAFQARPVANIVATALPVVERVEPDRLAERLWMAASCRPAMAEQPDAHAVHERIILAMLVARYDRAMAAALIAPALERLPELLADTSGVYFERGPVIQAVAAYDPRSIAVILTALPESARKAPVGRNGSDAASVDAQVRLAAAEVLGLPVNERREKVLGGYYPLRPFRRGR